MYVKYAKKYTTFPRIKYTNMYKKYAEYVSSMFHVSLICRILSTV